MIEDKNSDNKDFFEEILKIAEENKDKPFEPIKMNNHDGDMIEVYLKNDCYYAKWIDNNLSVFISEDTGEIIGYSIHGISHLYNNYINDDK